MIPYNNLADRVLAGTIPSREEGLAILDTPQDQLLHLVNAAYRIRSRYFGNTVRLQMLLNAKSGACQEDCHYCSQSTISTAPIERYALLSSEKMLAGARRAAQIALPDTRVRFRDVLVLEWACIRQRRTEENSSAA